MEHHTLERILWTTAIIIMVFLHLVSMATSQHSAHGKNLNPHDPTDNKFRDPEFVRNKEHVKEHLEGYVDTESEKEMTDEELEFHYFKLHDFDNNTKLDGLEIMAAISHVVPFEPPEKDMSVNQIADARVKYFSGIIDQVMFDDDYNKDGYLTYLEYVLSRRRHQDEPQDI